MKLQLTQKLKADPFARRICVSQNFPLQTMICKRKPLIGVDFKLKLDLFMEKPIMTYVFIRYMPANMQNSLNSETFFASFKCKLFGSKDQENTF